ncbi:Leucine Rich repeat [Lotmaria passim]
MYTSLGISAEQVYGDMYTAWLRDTHEKNTADIKRLYTTMIDNGFGHQQILLRRQRLGANFINSLVPLLHQSSLVKLDLHGNMLRDVGCELLVQVVRDLPCLTYLDIGGNAIGASSSSSSLAGGSGGYGGAGGKPSTRGSVIAGDGGGLLSRNASDNSAYGGNRGNGRGGGGGGSSSSRTGSHYLTAMRGLGAAIAQHKRLSVVILGSAKDESYANQIEEVGAGCVFEGCLLSRTLKRLDFSGNPFAVHCEVPADVLQRDITEEGSGGGTGVSDSGGGGATMKTENGGGGRSAPGSANRVGSGHGTAITRDENNNNNNALTSPAVNRSNPNIGSGGGSGSRSAPRTAVELLAQLFRTSTTLTHVHLRAVGLTDSGTAYLLEAAGASRSLLRLDMSENGLSSRVAEAAGLLLQQRTATMRGGGKGCSLQALVLSDNDLRDNAVAAAVARCGSFGITTPNNGGSNRNNNSRYYYSYGGGKSSAEGGRFAATAPAALSSSSSFGSRYVNRTRALRSSAAVASSSTSEAATGAAHYAAAASADSQVGMLLFCSLAHDQLLTSLILDRCALDDTALFALCRSLLTNASLTVLSLRDNQFSPDGVVQLGRALCRQPCLERLYLSGNAMGDEGACALATALGYPEATLVELDVARTWLGDRGLIALGVALQTNTSLQVLHVGDNHFTQEGGASFAALLENNQHVVRCGLSGTSVPHHVVLRLERATARNRARADSAEADALKKEVVRLHYSKYKLSEAQLELEALRDKNADVKRTMEEFDLQTKQGHSDFVKRIRELGEQIENAKEQEGRYVEQTAKLEADLAKAQETHEDDMSFATDRLAAEVKMREEAEEAFHAAQRELEDWRQNGATREAEKRARLAEMKADQEAWAGQRKEYRERTAELQRTIAELEAAAAAAAAATKKKKKGKKQ